MMPSSKYPSPTQMAVKHTELSQVERLGQEPSVILKEVLDLVEMALRQFRADVKPDKAMELLQNVVAIIKFNGGI